MNKVKAEHDETETAEGREATRYGRGSSRLSPLAVPNRYM